jgi:hypothetical protein
VTTSLGLCFVRSTGRRAGRYHVRETRCRGYVAGPRRSVAGCREAWFVLRLPSRLEVDAGLGAAREVPYTERACALSVSCSEALGR